MSVTKPNPDKLAARILTRQTQHDSMESLASLLEQYYDKLDSSARTDFINNTVRMYANYENRWLGESRQGVWVDDAIQGTNNVNFTVPLLTAHVDTNTTLYTKTKPKYNAIPFQKTHLKRQLAEMCREIATKELDRMLTYPVLQHEAQNIALATVSYRQIVMGSLPNSPRVTESYDETREVQMHKATCQDCGEEAATQDEPPVQCANEECMSSNLEMQEPMEGEITEKRQRYVKLPRPTIYQPNPIVVQDDFSAQTFQDSNFVITRSKISRKEAEYYYKIDLSASFSKRMQETDTMEKLARTPIGTTQSNTWPTLAFPDYNNYQNEKVDDIQMWLAPCEYGLHNIGGQITGDMFPEGLHLHIVGGVLVKSRPAEKNLEWVRVQQGVRPVSNKGMGLTHLADLNEAINNTVSLEYSILRTHGFPFRIIREKWLSDTPAANQSVLLSKIPEDRSLSEAVHTEQPANTSGLMGVLTQKFQGFMQDIGGSNASAMPSSAQDAMGSATAAAAFQERMSDRIGLAVQMRVEADMNTMYSVLTLLQRDPRNRQYFLDSGYSSEVVDMYFDCDFRSEFYFEVAKGTDEPSIDSVNTFKMQSFSQTTAALTGLREFDAPTFYDIVSALGETLNLDVTIGAGRKERNLADNKISRVIELYSSMGDELSDVDPMTEGKTLFEAVTLRDKQLDQAVLMTQSPQGEPESEEEMMLMMQEQQHIEETLMMARYDYDALAETYSDWLQSDRGQSAPVPIAFAVHLLWAESIENIERKKAAKQAEKMQEMQMAMMMSGGGGTPPASSDSPKDEDDKKKDNPPGPMKRDGTKGPGRPKDPPKPEEPK